MRESRSPPSLQGEALADNSGGASLSFKEGERGVIDVHNVIFVPIVIVVLNVFLVHNVLYDLHVHNVLYDLTFITFFTTLTFITSLSFLTTFILLCY